jgi:hypothetical protein
LALLCAQVVIYIQVLVQLESLELVAADLTGLSRRHSHRELIMSEYVRVVPSRKPVLPLHP